MVLSITICSWIFFAKVQRVQKFSLPVSLGVVIKCQLQPTAANCNQLRTIFQYNCKFWTKTNRNQSGYLQKWVLTTQNGPGPLDPSAGVQGSWPTAVRFFIFFLILTWGSRLLIKMLHRTKKDGLKWSWTPGPLFLSSNQLRTATNCSQLQPTAYHFSI